MLRTLTFSLIALSATLSTSQGAFILGVDFTDTGTVFPTFGSHNSGTGTENGNFGVDAMFNGTTFFPVTPNVAPITSRPSSSPVASSGSMIIPDGTDIDAITQDFFFDAGVGAQIEIQFTGLTHGSPYYFEAWQTDDQQGTGQVHQRSEFSFDGGANWITLQNAF